MATCQSCGSELTGPYCNTCGARAPEERAVKKPKAAKPAQTPVHAPAQSTSHRSAGALSPQRIGKTTALGLLALALYGAGVLTGLWVGGGQPASPIAGTSDPTAVTAAENLPIVLAGKYMDEGVEFMNKGERTAAAQSFKKSVAQYEKVLKDEPDNLYARTYLGLTYYYVGDSKKSLEALQAVLKADPNYLWALFNLGWIYQTAEKKPDAIAHYQKYLDVVGKEREDQIKYAEQYELIDRQIEAAKAAIAMLQGGGTR